MLRRIRWFNGNSLHIILSRGDAHRDIALIPSSAWNQPCKCCNGWHESYRCKCDDKGNIDIEDLHAKKRGTQRDPGNNFNDYTLLHMVFMKKELEITELIHKHGGQVYMDGANMNAPKLD